MTEALSVLGGSVVVQGALEGSGDILCHGRVEGTVNLDGMFAVGPQGVVRADIRARHVVVAGIVVGRIHGLESVELQAGCRVLGDITCPRLSMADGARYRGEVKMVEAADMPAGFDLPGAGRPAAPRVTAPQPRTPAAPARPAFTPRVVPAAATPLPVGRSTGPVSRPPSSPPPVTAAAPGSRPPPLVEISAAESAWPERRRPPSAPPPVKPASSPPSPSPRGAVPPVTPSPAQASPRQDSRPPPVAPEPRPLPGKAGRQRVSVRRR